MKPTFSSGVFSAVSSSAAASASASVLRIRASEADSTMIGASGAMTGAAAGASAARPHPRPHRRRSARPRRPRRRWPPSPRAPRRPRRPRCGARRRESRRSPAARSARAPLPAPIPARPRARRCAPARRWRSPARRPPSPARPPGADSPASSFSGKAARAIRQAATAPTTSPRRAWRAAQASTTIASCRLISVTSRIPTTNIVVAASAAPTGADEAGPDLAQPLAIEPARSVVADVAVGERQVQQHGDRAQQQQRAGPLAQAVDQRARAEAADGRQQTWRRSPDRRPGRTAYRGPTATAPPPGPMSGSPPICIDTSDIAANTPAGQQQDAADLAAAVLTVPLGGGFGGGGLGGHQVFVLVVRGGLTPTSDYSDRQAVKFPAFCTPASSRPPGRPSSRMRRRWPAPRRSLGVGRRLHLSGCLAQWANTASAVARVIPATAASSSTDASRTS